MPDISTIIYYIETLCACINCQSYGRRSTALGLGVRDSLPELAMTVSAQVYLHRLRRYIGAYLIHLQGDVDAIIFSAGMGENSAVLRGRALEGLQVECKIIFYIAYEETHILHISERDLGIVHL